MTKHPMNTRQDDDFDPEGWMSERPTYWLDLPDAESPTRLAWLRHRIRQAASFYGLREEAPGELRAKVPEEEWIRLSEMALGPLPRPDKKIKPARKNVAKKAARPASPDARGTARKPPAYSRPSTTNTSEG